MYRSHEVLPTVPATAPMNTKTGLDPDYTGPVPTMQPKAIAHQDRSDTEKQVVYESQLQVAYEPVAHISMDERYGGLEINPAESRDAISSKKRLLGGNSPRRRKLIILAIGGISVVLIAIIIAVVVAVTTTRKQNGSGGVEPSTSPVPTPSQPSGIPVPKIMAANSSLAAAGWALDTGKGTFSLRVIFQDPNGWLQARTYDSSKSTWANLTNITQAKLGSPLTLTRFDLSIYGGVQARTHDMISMRASS
ncbi:hypothetical protein K504DRAFT_87030 [Pleomassaria siparia CBS 279.74]|uniref:Uncharacterized protein n=1 Tax=Pleomassaria siparia CBS 279.74 TaxID=1314801 RepID=A0A6G1JZA6_9PLEO|nr:hypothetical protein K504DRAFT_87030 [Pleomassaria siparia CBS 279.74]